MSGGEFVDVLEGGVGRGNEAVGEELIEGRMAGRWGYVGKGEDRPNFGGEDEGVGLLGVVEGLDAEMVTGQEKAFFTAVPQAEGEHASQTGDKVIAPLFVGVNDNFGVGLGLELVSGGDELLAEFGGVVDFAVVGDPDGAVFVGKGLVAACKIDDAQAAGSKSGTAVGITAVIIRPPVSHPVIGYG